MNYRKFSIKLALMAFLAATLQLAFAEDVVHAVSGAVTRIDKSAKTLTVKTEDGTEHVFKYTDKTTVDDYRDAKKMTKKAAADTYFEAKEGSHVVVRYTDKGADKVADSVDDYGKNGLKESRGTVTKVDAKAHTVTVKAEDGTVATYDLGKNAAVDTEQGVVKGSEYTAKEGDHVVVHYSDDAGKKVVRFFKSM